jgi:hypothetical protein
MNIYKFYRAEWEQQSKSLDAVNEWIITNLDPIHHTSMLKVPYVVGHGRAFQLWLFPKNRAIRFCTAAVVTIFNASLGKR